MTTYEQELMSRITYEELAQFLKIVNTSLKLRDIGDFELGFMSDKESFLESMYILSKELDKTIFELYEKIKPITPERWGRITIEQWKKWAEKHNFQIVSNKNFNHVLSNNDFSAIIPLDQSDDMMFLIIETIMEEVYHLKEYDYLAKAKAIHDLVWELENL